MAKERESPDYSQLIREQVRKMDVEAFKERGVRTVNVINASKINELIARAVDSAIARMGEITPERAREDKTQIILDSMNEFKKLMQEHQPSGAHAAVGKQDGERIEVVLDEIHKLKAFLMNLQAKSQQEGFTREALLEEQRGILDAQSEEVRRLAHSHEQQSRRIEQEGELLRNIAGEISQLHEAVTGAATRPAFDPGVLTEAFQSAMTSMKRELMRDLEKSGVIKATAGPVSAESAIASSVIDSAFREIASGETESNMTWAKSHTTEASDQTAAALEKLRRMRKGQ